MESERPTTTTSTKKPVIRTLLALSSINGTLCVLVYGIGLLSMSMIAQMPYADYEALFKQQAGELFDADVMARSGELLRIFHDQGVALLTILLARTTLRLLGVVLMWRGRLTGFYVYAFAQIAGIFAPHIVLPWTYLGFFGPLMTVGMTALYGSQRRFLN